ncbi:hypothetical protein [Priestia megaterium]
MKRVIFFKGLLYILLFLSLVSLGFFLIVTKGKPEFDDSMYVLNFNISIILVGVISLYEGIHNLVEAYARNKGHNEGK